MSLLKTPYQRIAKLDSTVTVLHDGCVVQAVPIFIFRV